MCVLVCAVCVWVYVRCALCLCFLFGVCVCVGVWCGTLKKPPCGASKRLRLYQHDAHVCSTCGRVAGIHGGVLNVHTGEGGEGFRVPSRATHTHHTAHTQHSATRRQRQTDAERDREGETEKGRWKRRDKKINIKQHKKSSPTCPSTP